MSAQSPSQPRQQPQRPEPQQRQPRSPAPPLIEIRGITKHYVTPGGIDVPVLHGVDLTIARGELVAVMGQSGSGKSTLMNILGCLDIPSSGTYTLDGRDVSKLSDGALAGLRNRTIGFVFQGFNLLKRMSALDNVALPLAYAGVSRAEARRRARTRLEQTGLRDFVRRLPNQLSGGQQQRVAISRALVMDPPLVLADEPTGNLDSETSDEILDLFVKLNVEHGTTVVLVTHEPDVAARARRLVRLKDGVVTYDGPPQLGSDTNSVQLGSDTNSREGSHSNPAKLVSDPNSGATA